MRVHGQKRIKFYLNSSHITTASMPLSTLKYTNGEVTVVWKPDTCIHSKICWTELREVFDPFKKPWINMDGGTTERIIEQVRKCPSGALSYFMNNDGDDAK